MARALVLVACVAVLLAAGVSAAPIVKSRGGLGATCNFISSGVNTTMAYYYDVSALVGMGPTTNGYYSTTMNDLLHPHYFNLCGGVDKQACGTGQALCRDDGSGHLSFGTLASGSISGHPSGVDKGFVVRYSGGDYAYNCGTSDSRYSIIVTYTCDPKADKPVLGYVTSTGTACIYSMSVATKEACPVTPQECRYMTFKAGTAVAYDVNSLVGKGTGENGYFVNTDPNGDHYEYNICGGVDASKCGGAACMCQIDSKTLPHSTGTLNHPVFSDHPQGPTKGFVVYYPKGEVDYGCNTPDGDRRTTVTFNCDPAAAKPVMSAVSEDPVTVCDYRFSISSREACPYYIDGCAYTSGTYKYDVSSLVGKGILDNGYYNDTDSIRRDYQYNLCGGVDKSFCSAQAQAVCQHDNTSGKYYSLGTLAGAVITDHPSGPNQGFQIKYTGGDASADCQTPTGKRQVTVTVTCNAQAAKPILTKVVENPLMTCDYSFSFIAKEACPKAAVPLRGEARLRF